MHSFHTGLDRCSLRAPQVFFNISRRRNRHIQMRPSHRFITWAQRHTEGRLFKEKKIDRLGPALHFDDEMKVRKRETCLVLRRNVL